MLLLPSDVSAVNAMGVEVRHLLEWWCVVCDAINVRSPPTPFLCRALGPKSPILTAPFE